MNDAEAQRQAHKRYLDDSKCADIVRRSLACQEQRSPRNKKDKDFDKQIDCSEIIELYKACKKAERNAIIEERRRKNGY